MAVPVVQSGGGQEFEAPNPMVFTLPALLKDGGKRVKHIYTIFS
jgi:hypothetical protein